METPKLSTSERTFEGFNSEDRNVGNINRRLHRVEKTTDEVKLDTKKIWTAIQDLQEELTKVRQTNKELEEMSVNQKILIDELKRENRSSNEEINKLR